MKLDAQTILAIVAVAGVLINSFAILLQRQRDRVDASTKLATTATAMLAPLETRVTGLEKDNEAKTRLVHSQGEQIERLMKQTDEQRSELRAVKADRDQLLARVLIMQNEVQQLRKSRDELAVQVKAETALLSIARDLLMTQVTELLKERSALVEQVADLKFKLDRLMGIQENGVGISGIEG